MIQVDVENPIAVFDIGNVVVALNSELRDGIISANQAQMNNSRGYDSISDEVFYKFRTGKITEETYTRYIGEHLGVDPSVVLQAEVHLIASLNQYVVAKIRYLIRCPRD